MKKFSSGILILLVLAASSFAATMGELNALRSAKTYLEISGFSRSGLINQLIQGDGYSKKEATYAADNCGADWKEQAVRSAALYLQVSGFSRAGLIEQLMNGDGYTREQATYGAKKNGY